MTQTKKQTSPVWKKNISTCKIFLKPFGIFGTYVAVPPPRILASRNRMRQASHDTSQEHHHKLFKPWKRPDPCTVCKTRAMDPKQGLMITDLNHPIQYQKTHWSFVHPTRCTWPQNQPKRAIIQFEKNKNW